MVRGMLALVCLLHGAVLAESESPFVFHKARYTCAPLEFKVALPQGWKTEGDLAQLVAQRDDMGFRISREPFLGAPKKFAAAWGALLAEAGLDAEVKTVRAGRYQAFRGTYTWAAGRNQTRPIQIWRVYVPDGEWLYNFSFSVRNGVDPKPLVDGVLGSFRYIGGKPKPELSENEEKVGGGRPLFTFRMPRGYEKVERKMGGRPRPRLVGDGSVARWVKPMPGYKPPREAGRITLYAFNDRMGYDIGGESISGSELNTMVDSRWPLVSEQFASITKKPKGRNSRGGDFKGRLFTAAGATKEGIVRRFFAFGLKAKGWTIVLTLHCDERELLLHKNLFKAILKTFKEPKK